MAGLKSDELRLEPYDAEWPRLFAAEAAALRAALGPSLLAVEHIGSTAVPGMPAKPVIDIAIRVRSFDVLPHIVSAMAATGYAHKGEFGLPGRQFFTKGDPVLFHAHVVETQSPHWRRWTGFRDALLGSAQLRDDYEKEKRRLVARHAANRPAYTAAKSDFICRALGESPPPRRDAGAGQ